MIKALEKYRCCRVISRIIPSINSMTIYIYIYIYIYVRNGEGTYGTSGE